jgi:hypothetical protein
MIVSRNRIYLQNFVMNTDYVTCDATIEFLNLILLITRQFIHGNNGQVHTRDKIESLRK